MAIGRTHLTDGSSGTDASSRATSSITPTANKLVIATIMSRKTGGGVEPAASGNNLTWNVAESVAADLGRRLTTFWAIGSSPSASALTFTFSSETQEQFIWTVDEFDPVSGSGTIVQSNTGTGSDNTAEVVLSDFDDAINNAVYFAQIHRINELTTPDGDYDEIVDISHNDGGVDTNMSAQWMVGEDTSPSASWTTGLGWAAIALEIAALIAASNPIIKPGGKSRVMIGGR